MDEAALPTAPTKAFQGVFASASLAIFDFKTGSDNEGWDSLAQVNSAFAWEERFGGRFATAEVRALKNVVGPEALIALRLRDRG